MPAFDLILSGGRVVDGSGAEPLRADVGIGADRITAVGDLAGADAAERLDVTGLLVFPGFIDVHAHVDAVLPEPRVQQALLRQGVTSVIIGQDGISFAPTGTRGLRHAERYFAAVNGRVGGEGYGVAERLRSLAGGSAVNVGQLVPAGTVRADVIGLDDRPATPAELARMVGVVEQALAEGALGLSTGLDYVPGGFAGIDELVALADPVGAAAGALVSHLRGYASERIADAIGELALIAERSGANGHISHLTARFALVEPLLDAAAERGTVLSFDSYPYLRGATILAMIALPPELQAGGPGATVARLGQASVRHELRMRWFPANPRLFTVRLAYIASHDFAWAEGMPLTEAARAHGADLADFVCELLVASDLAVGCVVDNGADRDECDVRALLRRPEQLASSDAIYLGSHPHPRGWGAFARLLGRHVRELGDWTWGEAAWHLAGHAAQRFGLADRGSVTQGTMADLAVVDPAVVADVADYGAPVRPAVGVPHVLVAGRFALRDGEVTAERPGRPLLRGFARIVKEGG
ncbi:N-acyl-D-amino-acid deacylase family protein [Gryllotalpicola protaetiae]|uniref:D-aminoacylase n=1 Tax=Gryllotalpicola protaetiae TaxID=2419771 RepID=A0A387BSF0_9MICO|nr:amidohydrolase family protein [Gryllotalpicola protaetiae]AYG03857.1 D-aminoacylase [Gryllotalpicola protaetiae]